MEESTHLRTDRLGGVEVGAEQLEAMQAGGYILHARNGKLKKAPVEKTRMPLDPQGYVQDVRLVLAPNGTIYAS
jgi:hypothetical protein